MPRPSSYTAPSAALALLNQAVQLHQAGRLDEAAERYEQVCSRRPATSTRHICWA